MVVLHSALWYQEDNYTVPIQTDVIEEQMHLQLLKLNTILSIMKIHNTHKVS